MTQTKRSTARRSMMAVASVAAAGMVLAACSSGSSSDASSSAAPAASSAAASAAASPAASAAGSAAAAGGVAEAQALVASLEGPVTSWAEVPALSALPDVKGKTVFIVPIGDGVPVINGVRTGIEQALTAAGATTQMCDGKFNPTDIAGCLKLATDQGAAAIITMFVDYAMVPTAFDAAASAGVPVLVGGVTPTGGRTADATLAFLDLSGQSAKMFEATALSAVAAIGEGTNAIFLRLTDSENSSAAADAAIAAFQAACPTCTAVPVDFSTPTIDKLPSAVSAALVSNPDTNALIANVDGYLAPAIAGIQSAGAAATVQLFGANGDVEGLQRVKDGKQAADAGIPVNYVGWQYANGLMQLLAGDTVQPVGIYEGRIFDATNVADLAITPDAYPTLDWYGGDSSFQDQYLTAWGVK